MSAVVFLQMLKWSVRTLNFLWYFETGFQAKLRFSGRRAINATAFFLLFAICTTWLHAGEASPAATNTPSALFNSTTEATNSASSFAAEGPAAYKKMSLQELMNLDVTSVARAPEPFSQAPASIVVITQDEIRRSGASSIPEALRLADNLDVAQRNSHDWSISARGFNTALGNKLLVMIDGRTVYSPLFSGVFWNAQDYLLEDIDRIEVISGPGGTLWGANAVNGVINIITKNTMDTQGLYLEGGGGIPGTGEVAGTRSVLRGFAGVRYGGVLASNVYFRVYGKYFDRGNEEYPDGSPANDSWSMGQGGFRIDAMPSSLDDFTLQGDIYGSDLSMPSGGLANQSGGNLLGRWSHTISGNADMSLQLYYDQTHLSDPETETVLGNTYTQILTDDLRTYDLDFQYRVKLGGRHQVIWGTGFRHTHDVVGESEIVQFLPPVLDRNLYSAFVQDQIQLLEHVFLTLGTKVEHNDYTGFEVEPSGRLQWNVTTNQMIWGAVSRAVRMPSRVDTDIRENSPNPPFTILAGSPNFESEAMIAYELGYRAQLTEKLSTSISTYYNDYTDIRSTSFTPATVVPLYFANNLEGHTYGLELSVDYQVLEGWRLHGGYNLIKEHIHIKPGEVDINNALNETADPQQQFFLRSSFDLPRNIELDGALRWVDRLTINNGGTPATVPSYFELDSRLAWHPTRWLELAIIGQNLLHARHVEYGVPGGTPNQEEILRAVYGKVSIRW